MKIIIVCYPTFGGSGVLATELGHQLSENGHSVHFIAYEKPVRLKVNDESIFFHKVNVPFYPLFNFQPYELALSTKIVDVATKNSIDLIHVHYAIPHAYAAYMAQKMLKMNNIKLPIITTLHGTDITLVGKHPFYKNAVKISIEIRISIKIVVGMLIFDSSFPFFISFRFTSSRRLTIHIGIQISMPCICEMHCN